MKKIKILSNIILVILLSLYISCGDDSPTVSNTDTTANDSDEVYITQNLPSGFSVDLPSSVTGQVEGSISSKIVRDTTEPIQSMAFKQFKELISKMSIRQAKLEMNFMIADMVIGQIKEKMQSSQDSIFIEANKIELSFTEAMSAKMESIWKIYEKLWFPDGSFDSESEGKIITRFDYTDESLNTYCADSSHLTEDKCECYRDSSANNPACFASSPDGVFNTDDSITFKDGKMLIPNVGEKITIPNVCYIQNLNKNSYDFYLAFDFDSITAKVMGTNVPLAVSSKVANSCSDTDKFDLVIKWNKDKNKVSIANSSLTINEDSSTNRNFMTFSYDGLKDTMHYSSRKAFYDYPDYGGPKIINYPSTETVNIQSCENKEKRCIVFNSFYIEKSIMENMPGSNSFEMNDQIFILKGKADDDGGAIKNQSIMKNIMFAEGDTEEIFDAKGNVAAQNIRDTRYASPDWVGWKGTAPASDNFYYSNINDADFGPELPVAFTFDSLENIGTTAGIYYQYVIVEDGKIPQDDTFSNISGMICSYYNEYAVGGAKLELFYDYWGSLDESVTSSLKVYQENGFDNTNLVPNFISSPASIK